MVNVKPCPLCKNRNSRLERVLNGIDLLKCQDCEFVYADMSDEEIDRVNSAFHDEDTSRYEELQTVLDEAWFANIARRFTRKLGPGKVLDVGCGNGLLLKHFKACGWDCYGIDPSPWSKELSERYGFFVQGKLEDSNFEEASFDLVVSSATLEHIAQPLPHVERIVKLIRPDGLGYFAGIPNYGSISIVLGFSRFYWNIPPVHVNYFTPRTLSGLFDRLKTPPRRAMIKAYGIPETHQIYNILARAIRRGARRVLNYLHVSEGAERTKRRGTAGEIISELLLYLWYYPGRVCSMGDKLEVTIIR